MPKKATAKTVEISSVDKMVANQNGPEAVTTQDIPDDKPEPKPGDKDFDWANLYGTDDLYVHTFSDGKVVALKPFSAIFSKTWLYKIRNFKSAVDIELAAIDRGSCDAAREVLGSLDDSGDGDPIDDLWKAWSTAGTSHGDGDEGLTSGN